MTETVYDIILETPLGPRRGSADVRVKDGNVEGTLHVLGRLSRFCGSVDASGALRLRGALLTLVRRIDFAAEGRMDGEHIELTLHGARDVLRVTGTRKGEWEHE